MKKVKYTIEELRELATRSYPSALKEVLSNKYKVDGFNGYLLLDNLNNDGTVPQLFYDGKWRQDNINIIKDNILYTLINSDGLTFGRFGTVKEAMKNIKELKDNLRLNGYNIVANWETAEAIELPITKDNIHLYYEFLSPDTLSSLKENTKAGLSSIFQERINTLSSNLNIDDNSFGEHFKVESEGRWINKSFVFGVKDTIKPLDEYTAEIKESPKYINYQLQELLKQNNRKYIKVCDIDQDIYSFSTMNTVYIGKYKHPTAKALDGEHLLIEGVLCHDNISTYYEFMSDEDRKEIKTSAILGVVFKERIPKIFKGLGVQQYEINNKDVCSWAEGVAYRNMTSITFFGVKDTLKPLDEYIAEIKESPAYQETKEQIMNKLVENYIEFSRETITGDDWVIDYSNIADLSEKLFGANLGAYGEMGVQDEILSTVVKDCDLTNSDLVELFGSMEQYNSVSDLKVEDAFSVLLEDERNRLLEKKASIRDIQTDPELETPEGLEQAKENLVNKLSQNSNTQDYN